MHLKILLFASFMIFLGGCQTSEPTLPMPKNYQKQSTKPQPKSNGKKYTINTSNVFYTPKTKPAVTKPIGRNLKFSGSGYIKGVVKNVYYDKKRDYWVYYIKGTDLSNGKLGSTEAYGVKRVAHTNDFVYAVIKDGFIKSIYIYKSSKNYTVKKKKIIAKKSKHKKIIRKNYKKTPQTRQRKQVISAPKAQTVTF